MATTPPTTAVKEVRYLNKILNLLKKI